MKIFKYLSHSFSQLVKKLKEGNQFSTLLVPKDPTAWQVAHGSQHTNTAHRFMPLYPKFRERLAPFLGVFQKNLGTGAR